MHGKCVLNNVLHQNCNIFVVFPKETEKGGSNSLVPPKNDLYDTSDVTQSYYSNTGFNLSIRNTLCCAFSFNEYLHALHNFSLFLLFSCKENMRYDIPVPFFIFQIYLKQTLTSTLSIFVPVSQINHY